MSFLDDFCKRIEEEHKQEVAKGLHDTQCEWHPSHYMCHCSKRRREAKGHTEPPGPLSYSYPTCTRCWQEVDHDGDAFVCESCKVMWDPNDPDDEGEFTDDYGELKPPPAEHLSQ